MLKYIKHHLETIVGVEIYPLISFIIFFTFFIGLLAYVIMMRKSYIEELENIPLTEND
jgi:hypothetical protein